MALPAALVWQIQSTGNAANGGAFLATGAGVDASQQDAPLAIYDGATLALTASGAGSTLTCPGRPFVASDAGNVLNVTGGTNLTTGRYYISSVAAGVATLDRAVSTGASSNGTGRLGGAVAAPSTAFTAGVASNTYYLFGSFAVAGAISGPAAGTQSAPTMIIGYSTTRAAAANATPGSELATITTSSSASPVLTLNGNTVILNLVIDAAGLSNYCFQTASNSRVRNCRALNYEQRGFVFTGNSQLSADDCVASGGDGGDGTASDLRCGFSNTQGTLYCTRCVSQSGSTNGFGTANATIVLDHCIATGLTQKTSAGGHGVQVFGDGDVIANHCTFNNLQGSGIYTNGSASMENSQCHNSIFSNISRHAFEGATGATAMTVASFANRFRYNAFYNVTLARQGGAVTVFGTGHNEISLTSSPFNSSIDFGLNTTVGGGASLRQAGIPGLFSLLDTTTGYPDIGAVQASVASGGGVSAATMRTLWRELVNEEDTTRIPDSVVDLYLGGGMEALNDRARFSWTDTTISLVAGTQEYDMPSDCLYIEWMEHNSIELVKADIDELRRRSKDWRDAPAGTPQKWAFYGSKVVMLPTPDAQAVAAAGTITVRYVRTPRDFTTYGPEQLATRDYRTVVYWGVAEWSIAHPDNAIAAGRATGFRQMFDEAAAMAAERYKERKLTR